jgi:Fic family protein
LLALRYIGKGNMGVTQSDVRSLHSVVMAGSIFAGGYRQLGVDIQDADHKPFAADDIGYAMQQFADWTRRSVDVDYAILRAAVGHAWLTHVHPFYDGNGRVARLVPT